MASSGNFCTLNPLDCDDDGDLINGNLTLSHTDSAWRTAFGNMGVSSGKWYFESRQVNSASGNGYAIAVQRMSEGLNYKSWTAQGVGGSVGTYGYGYAFYTKGSGDASEKVHNNSYVTTSDITAGVAGDVYQIALDLDNNKVWFGKNNTWHNSGDPANNSNETYSSLPAGTYCSAVCVYTTSSDYFTHNYGQDSTFGGVATAGGNADGNGFGDFAYAPPTGFLAICTGNLPISSDIDPAQTDDNYPGKQFNSILYTGNGGTNAITGLGFKPDLVWLKRRDSSASHQLYDSSRGAGKLISSNTSDAEQTVSTGVNSFDSDGFTLGSAGGANASGATFVAWCWRANGGTTASNSEGSITSTVQANPEAGFSIIQYTGTGSNLTMGHGLTKTPEFIAVKNRDASVDWNVYHVSIGYTKYAKFNSYEPFASNSAVWNAAPTADVINIGNAGTSTNGSGANYVCYAWHSVEGYSKFGTYEGNGDDENGPFIYTGFRPRLIFCKNADTNNEWFVQDTARETKNVTENFMEWDTSDAEQSNAHSEMDILSNGFKCRGNSGRFNDTATYVYGAWGDVPFKYNNTF